MKPFEPTEYRRGRHATIPDDSLKMSNCTGELALHLSALLDPHENQPLAAQIRRENFPN